MTESGGVLIVWHSRTGGSEQLALAARDGAIAASETVSGPRVRMLGADETQAADMLEARGYLFTCPENLAAVSGSMKEFFDRCYYPLLGRIEARPYASIICAGSDGQGAARQIARIATGWRLRVIAEPLIVGTQAQTPEEILAPKLISEASLARAHELGGTMAAGLALGIH